MWIRERRAQQRAVRGYDVASVDGDDGHAQFAPQPLHGRKRREVIGDLVPECHDDHAELPAREREQISNT